MMHRNFQRVLSTACIGALAAAVSLVAAPSASAVTAVTLACGSTVTVRVNTGADIAVFAPASDPFLVVDSNPDHRIIAGASVGSLARDTIPHSVHAVGAGTTTGTWNDQLVQGVATCTAVLQFVVVDPAVEVIPAPIPHDYLQQVGVPASGDCADVDPHVGHWYHFPTGGWSKSWAQWINDGTGGEVCTRELVEDGGVVRLVG